MHSVLKYSQHLSHGRNNVLEGDTWDSYAHIIHSPERIGEKEHND